MACCKACAQVAGRRRKHRSAGVGQIFKTMKRGSSRSKLIVTAAKIGGGFVAGQVLENFGPLKDNKFLSAGAKIVGGIVLAGMSKSTQEIALGLAASGIVDLTQQFTKSSASGMGLGLIPYSGAGSSTVPGVAGDYGYSPNSGMMVVG